MAESGRLLGCKALLSYIRSVDMEVMVNLFCFTSSTVSQHEENS